MTLLSEGMTNRSPEGEARCAQTEEGEGQDSA